MRLYTRVNARHSFVLAILSTRFDEQQHNDASGNWTSVYRHEEERAGAVSRVVITVYKMKVCEAPAYPVSVFASNTVDNLRRDSRYSVVFVRSSWNVRGNRVTELFHLLHVVPERVISRRPLGMIGRFLRRPIIARTIDNPCVKASTRYTTYVARRVVVAKRVRKRGGILPGTESLSLSSKSSRTFGGGCARETTTSDAGLGLEPPARR